ncbi:MAG: hypothetical protein HF300_10790 [Ignavibacteria bacterium]|jgi:hypothetical protein|nr:hypothetical protein [Ignavibacteria bacterium]MCU7499577.1 hypothetical protein [Ignavibacteria bacterium]MCU7513036.1 hypothetical protein [Ignavibacteria bacterium]MCU7519278.1 hypothetical protein [Ignavibacteria bacterium]MCU7526465.1 hypothetical protein [Ignavibacteria bacterium]
MNHKLIKFISILLLLAGFTAQVYAEGVSKGSKRPLRKTNGTPSSTKFNINQIATWFINDGSSDLDNLGNSGFVYPKGSGKTAFFQSGFVWGGKVGDNIRVGGSTYQSGVLPGAVINGTPQDPGDPSVHIYRVRRDYKTGGMTTEMADGEGSEADIRAQYDNDWMTWPADLGAPYEDVNGDGKYDPNVDIPGVPGADQTIWYVNNDFDRSTVKSLYGSEPIGLECQTTVWGYNMGGALGNMLFRKYKIINKGTNNVKDMYVSMWSDPDLGDATDDLAGCDTTLSLAFIYNGKGYDKVYGDYPPAAGFDFFQGPVVAGTATDTAIFNGKKVPGKKNLPMTAFYYFINGSDTYSDPDLGPYYETGTKAFYRLLQGQMSTKDEYFPIPADLGGGVTKFPLSGDPIAGTGYLDGKLFDPDDRRFGMSSGPFTMAVGDTQEIVVAQMAAGGPGSGQSYIDALKTLKNYDKKAQEAYDKFFVLPSAPRAPMVDVTELDQEIDLNWGAHLDQVAETEAHNKEGYKFQGYNVYQLPRANSGRNEAIRLFTYDVATLEDGSPDTVKLILDNEVDPKSGLLLPVVKQFGNNTGIVRTLKLEKDYITGQPLVNGKKYYYAVTAYAYNPDKEAVPNNLESSLAPITIVPHAPNPGVKYNSSYGELLPVTRTGGKSDGSVIATVVDPAKVNGHTYQVTFDTIRVFNKALYAETKDSVQANELRNAWTLTDMSTTPHQVKIFHKLDQAGTSDSLLTFDGLIIKVLGPPEGMKSDDPNTTDDASLWGWNVTAGKRQFTWSGANGFGLEGFQGAMGMGLDYGSTVPASNLKNVVLKLAQVDSLGNVLDQNDPDVSYAYRFVRKANKDLANPAFGEFITNKVGGWAYQDFKKNFPFAAYDVEDPAHPRRLAIGYLENNMPNGTVDGKYWPPVGASNTADDSPREWFFIYDTDYKETPDPELAGPATGSGVSPMLYWSTVDRRYDAPWSGKDELALFVNHINLPADSWTFTSKTVEVSSEYAKADVEKINVFPNPYYGANSQELNKYQRFVTFSHLPQSATIRIFNLAGQLVRTIRKDSPDQFQRWDLATESGLPVASGLYIVYVDMPELGKTKILKVAVIQEQQILDRF